MLLAIASFFYISDLSSKSVSSEILSAITASITLSMKKLHKITSTTQTRIAIQGIEASIKLYMMVDQPSSVTIWNMVIIPYSMLSKVVMPKLIRG